MMKLFLLSALCALQLLPIGVVGECTCDIESLHRDKSTALKYKLGAIASILVASTIGLCLPLLGKFVPALKPERDVFYLIKAFAAGVILSTGFIHVLPDSFDNLTSPCLNDNPWANFPFAGFVAMAAAIGTLMIDTYVMSYYTRISGISKAQPDDVEVVGAHHVSGHALVAADSPSELIRRRVISQVRRLLTEGTKLICIYIITLHIYIYTIHVFYMILTN